MSRVKGTANFSGTIEPLAGGALDARDIVQTKADLTASGSFPYAYIGMETYVVAEDKKYRFIGDDTTVLANWEEVGSGGGVAHTGFTPVGTVISVMGNTAPANYLTCNGQIVNISDYKELADYFEAQFGTKNHFGGDGTTTFAVPDLRGEFLRGTGTNSHANQGDGDNVGVHQDATEAPMIAANTTGTKCLYVQTTEDGVGLVYADSTIEGESTTGMQTSTNSMSTTWAGSTGEKRYMTRPTNTSVLYCIATKNIYIDARYDYSTDEKVVGTWIDEKPIYQKTIDCGALPNATTKYVSTDIDASQIVKIEGFATTDPSGDDKAITIPLPFAGSGGSFVGVYAHILDTNKISIRISADADRTAYNGFVTVQYTKPSN